MLYGVKQAKLNLSSVFILLEAIFETSSTELAEKLWPIMETRKDQLLVELSGIKGPGTTLLRTLNALLKRLDCLLHAEFRAKIEMYLAEALAPDERIIATKVAENPLFYREDDTKGEDYELLLKVEKALANTASIAESNEALHHFLKEADSLAKLFSASQNNIRASYSPLVLSPELFKHQCRDLNFQFKVSAQILIFIEAILLLRPAQREKYGTKRATKSTIWAPKVLDGETLELVQAAKKTWFNLMRLSSTKEQLEIMRISVNREKEILYHKLNEQTFKGGADVDLKPSYEPKVRKKHHHDMGNMQLSKLWQQELGNQDFVAPKELAPGTPFYEKSQTLEGEESEGARWISLYLQRYQNWKSFNTGTRTRAIGHLFGATPSPKSPRSTEEDPMNTLTSKESDGVADSEKDVVPGGDKNDNASVGVSNEENRPEYPKSPNDSRDGEKDDHDDNDRDDEQEREDDRPKRYSEERDWLDSPTSPKRMRR